MENRPPRSRPVGSPQSLPQGAAAPAEGSLLPAPDSHQGPDEAFHSLGSTRVLGEDTGAISETTELRENTEVQFEGKNTSDEITVLGDFELINKLGEGAMGEVWKAHRVSFDREVVALKVLFPHVAANPKLIERLNREARTMFALDHPNIVASYAIDEDKDYYFVAMEFVDGDSLQKWLSRLKRFTIPDALAITMACARALEYAHKNDVIHRDIKPDNVLIDRLGTVKVADLGMVKTPDEDMALTQTGHAVGTPWYMPLEQARDAKDADGRCDIYALGCMLYCLLTGNPPFSGRTLVEVIQAKEVGTFPRVRGLNPDAPERLDMILMKMTAKLPKNRYQNCADLIKDLESLGLAGDKLSFLDGNAAKVTLKATKTASAPEVTNDEWYVRVNRDGDIRKLTFDQVKKLLEEEAIDPSAQASRQARDGFRALATYKEFQGTAFVKQSKKAADRHSAKYRSIYKKIEEKERRRDEEEKVKKDDLEPSYYSSLWTPGMLIGGGVGGALFLFYILFRLFNG